MKTYKLIVIIIVVASVAGITIYSIKKMKSEKRLTTVSDAGYETAYDILYPSKGQRLRKRL